MRNRWVMYGIGVMLVLVLSIAIPVGLFWRQHEETIRFIQAKEPLFTAEFADSWDGQQFNAFIETIHNDPQILSTLRKNENALRDGAIMVNIHNQELGYYEDEVRFPEQCADDATACKSIRTILTASRENNVLAYEAAFQYWIEESNNQPDAIAFFNAVFNACVYVDSINADGTNGFRGCQNISERIIQEALELEPTNDLRQRIQLYAIERSVANYRYDYKLFESTANRFFNDRQLRTLIQTDFDTISAFLWLPDNLRAEFNIDYDAYRKAQRFATEYSWVMENVIGINEQ